MKVSVVIPLYNKEEHIERTLQSILQQTYSNHEIIVVNDGSTDRGPDIVKNYLSDRIKLLIQQNKGISAARNRGLEIAEGQLVTFLDADDAWQPCFLETIVKLYKKFPEAGLYATSYQFKKEDGSLLRARLFSEYKEAQELLIDNFFKASLADPLFHVSSMCVPREIAVREGGFNTELKRGEDYEFYIRIAMKKSTAYKNIIGSTYYLNATNRICRRLLSPKKKKYLVEEYLQNYILNNGDYADDFKELVAKFMIRRSKYFILQRDKKEALRLLWKYRDTKYFRKMWLKYCLALFVPVFVNRMMYSGSWRQE